MLTTIGAQAFQNCPLLNGFVIPVSVNSIGENAFYNSGLNLTFATGSIITTIDNYAFWGAKFTSFIIPVGVTTIRLYAFYNCSGLIGVTIPSSVTTIGFSAFQSCSNLASVTFEGASTNIPITIGQQAFRYCKLSHVTLSESSNNESNKYAFLNQIPDIPVTFTFICFHKGTTILCLNAELTDEYIPVESLKVGDLVKTYKHGYRRIAVMLSYHMRNDSTTFGKSLHRMNKTDTMTADLILTGWHSILVDDLGDYEKENTKRFGEVQIIDGKYLLLCAISRDFTMLEDTDDHSVYHFCLDGDGDENARYGVYANGVLCETPSIAITKKYS